VVGFQNAEKMLQGANNLLNDVRFGMKNRWERKLYIR
jgi:hypothetical protein